MTHGKGSVHAQAESMGNLADGDLTFGELVSWWCYEMGTKHVQAEELNQWVKRARPSRSYLESLGVEAEARFNSFFFGICLSWYHHSSTAQPPSLLPRRRLTESFSREEQWRSTSFMPLTLN
ncbi:hypothetical protein RJ639_007557 [Escallonia herrerae]|uniref:Uncharacterized protein n=1 Tax=Escallonia herrerae TaxID=1293975 RepID=A0AA88VXD1_9ASTE|nr:hypothetical protein RJ639_007557 [Escallonia herrerae]